MTNKTLPKSPAPNTFFDPVYVPPTGGSTSKNPNVRPFFQYYNMLQTYTTMMAVVSLLDRVGVFKAMRGAGRVSVQDLAKKTGLQERYLKESLSAMAAGGIVLYHPEKGKDLGTFEPEEHALILVDDWESGKAPHPLFYGGQSENLVAYWSVVPKLAEAFKAGGGVKFGEFGPELPRGMARTHEGTMKSVLVRKWLPAIPGLVEKLERGVNVLDVGCGAAAGIIAMAQAFPNSTFKGVDLDAYSVSQANEKIRQAGLAGKNCSAEVRSVYDLIERDAYDVIFTFDVVHDLPDPLRGLKEILAALKPSGLYVMMEPRCSDRLEENLNMGGAFLYSVSTVHCMTQSLGNGGAGLGAAWGPRKMKEYCMAAGAKSFEEFPVPNPGNAFYGIRKSQASKL
ncbi:S-adenosyl-L-methionine-dependent methyltransferase [Gonapodya prolifera JEL478]|uniref:S-adenosyl-L-methionine-dependent methyltransferase n=1 Tax=Gonapodya prolifera (strain JEL478) TaxID=1344416 RepID=A0A139A9A9_GONPJ|nr:S-adenosyl-L-methionine-dependent methyltransferase [Gonapodya prolifera JEL478]|eukprot:KXS13248.1 S-adenosyl-L-methionine-dependent methyltransferase [Gonapodya prolifera JEL478]